MCQKYETKSVLWNIFLTKFCGGNGLDWLCILAGYYQAVPRIFFIFQLKKIILQNTFALKFLTHIILAILVCEEFNLPYTLAQNFCFAHKRTFIQQSISGK